MVNLLNQLYPFAIDDVTTVPYVQVRMITGYCKARSIVDSSQWVFRLALHQESHKLAVLHPTKK